MSEGSSELVNEAFSKLQKLVSEFKSSRPKKSKITIYKRDSSTGNRTYPSSSRKRYNVKRKIVSNNDETADADSCSTLIQPNSNELKREDNYGENEIHDECDNEFLPAADDIRDDIEDDTAFNNIKKLIESIKSKQHIKRKYKSWYERMLANEESWIECREDMLSAELGRNFHIDTVCHHCHVNRACVKCQSCSCFYFCEECDKMVHSFYPLHNRVAFLENIQYQLQNTELVAFSQIKTRVSLVPLVTGRCKTCCSFDVYKVPNDKICVVVTNTGRFDLFQYDVHCNECHSVFDPFNISTVLESGYWPSVPNKFNLLFNIEVFELWDSFRKNMPGSSERSFLESLACVGLSKGRVGKINQDAFSCAFKEWCFLNHEKNIIKNVNYMECPCCTIKQHSSHVDGNCKLYRYRTSGRRRRNTHYSSLFLVSDEERDAYLREIYNKKNGKSRFESDKSCGGEWNAARNTPQKRKSLDITGLEVASCRHQLAQKAVNMHRGELYGYAMYLIKHFLVEKQNVKFVFADIMCKLKKFIDSHDFELGKKFEGALSVMHAKGHSFDCQVLWDGEWKNGTGRSTGEECEQLFSYLSRASNTTKYQRPENREETLTELAMFWNMRKIKNMATSLVTKYRKVTKDLAEWTVKQDSLCSELELASTEIDWNNWVKDARDYACHMKSRHLPLLSPSQTAVILYHDLQIMPRSCSPDVKAVLDEINLPSLKCLKIPVFQKTKEEKQSLLSDVIRSCSISTILSEVDSLTKDYLPKALDIAKEELLFEKMHWAARMKKCADSSKQRTFFRRKLSATTKKLEELDMTIANVKTRQQEVPSTQSSDIDSSGKRALLEVHLKIERCQEELSLLKGDMKSYLKYYANQVETIGSGVAELEAKYVSEDEMISASSRGKLCLLKNGLAFSEYQLAVGVKAFADILPEIESTVARDINDIPEIDFECEENEENSEIDMHGNSDEYPGDESDNIEISAGNMKSIGDEFLESKQFLKNSLPNDVLHLSLPSNLCQSSINNRNGSSSCVIISLLIGYIVKEARLDENCVQDLVSHFVGCMEVGNLVYGGSDYLTPEEALTMLPNNLPLSVESEFNCTLFREHSIQHKIDAYWIDGRGYLLIVKDFKCMCLVKSGHQLFLFDSHALLDRGGSIFICNPTSFSNCSCRLINVHSIIIYICQVLG